MPAKSHLPICTRTLTVVLALTLSALFLPAVAFAAEGAISGTVTSHRTKAGIEFSEVCAEPEFAGTEECAITNEDGEYTISRLAPGKYAVNFTGVGCFFGVFCDEDTYFGETTTGVTVSAKTITEGVDAELKEKDGEISGKVTAGGAPLAHVEACTEDACASSGANGEYTIEGVAPGKNTVSFSIESECNLICTRRGNYLTSFYSGQLSAETATEVNVASEAITTGINEEMRAGGEISGKVSTASVSPQAVGGFKVCAITTATDKEGTREDEDEECALTNASGEYTIFALGAHAYEVRFTGVICVEEAKGKDKCTQPYVSQYYPGIVAVTPPGVVAGIDASVLEVTSAKPASTAAPALTGTTTVGSVLSCAQGTWSNNPASFAYRWLRGGSAIAGQTTSTYTVQSGDPGSAIACEVTATNAAGSTGATSNTLQIPKPKPATGVAVLVKLKLKGSTVSITLRCTGAGACTGALKLLGRIVAHKHASDTAIASTASFTIEAGHSLTLRVHLSSKGRKLLAHAGKKGLSVQIAGTGVKAQKSTLR
ncbi:MAG TPA: carboxypeptidase regulatory-like domain-containing protein [Solirubrobacteraceae bacterium]|jgi:hypothetical protein|nr:carboxypeptidase regulatory-like domain-containing protein [Solirubrobacteraceae bacterium]